MAYRITALFLDPRREFPLRFSELLLPEIQFDAFDRVSRAAEAIQKHLYAEYNLCFISDKVNEPLDGFFVDIANSGRDQTCLFVKLLSSTDQPQRVLEQGFALAITENPTAEDCRILLETIAGRWHSMEMSRRTGDLDSTIGLLMRHIDEAATAKRRGRDVKMDRGATSLVRMHTEYDASILDEFLSRLTLRLESAKPILKILKRIPMAMLKRDLPELNERGYHGVSNRVFNMLVDRLGDEITPVPPGRKKGDADSV